MNGLQWRETKKIKRHKESARAQSKAHSRQRHSN